MTNVFSHRCVADGKSLGSATCPKRLREDMSQLTDREFRFRRFTQDIRIQESLKLIGKHESPEALVLMRFAYTLMDHIGWPEDLWCFVPHDMVKKAPSIWAHTAKGIDFGIKLSLTFEDVKLELPVGIKNSASGGFEIVLGGSYESYAPVGAWGSSDPKSAEETLNRGSRLLSDKIMERRS